MNWNEHDGVRWLEAELPGARAAFTARIGGVSEPPFESLNLGLRTGDQPEAVRENRARVAAALGRDPDGVLLGRQIHGAEVLTRELAPRPNPYLELIAAPAADAQATRAAALTPSVQVADCLPVALSGPGGVAILHCGWRGLAAGIVARGVEAVTATAAAIGPGIGPCCYRVGDEVRRRFDDLGEGIAADGMLDLVEITRRLLAAAGVNQVEVCGLCTHCEPELFFSHRRDAGRAGRQAGFVWRCPDR